MFRWFKSLGGYRRARSVSRQEVKNVPKETTNGVATLVSPSGLEPDERPSSWYEGERRRTSIKIFSRKPRKTSENGSPPFPEETGFALQFLNLLRVRKLSQDVIERIMQREEKSYLRKNICS
jgi:hypothetical protein